MGRVVASASDVRVLWAAALVALLGALAVMTMATTVAAAAAESGRCCCPCCRGAPVNAASDFVEMDGPGRSEARPMGAAADAGGDAGATQFPVPVR